jgi:hypothetical protein
METKSYRLKHGHNHFQDGLFLEGGSVVQLTDEQYASFKDKFVAEGEPLPPPPVVEDLIEEEEDADDGDAGEEDETDDEEGDDVGLEEGDQSVGEEVPAGDPNESPIARRRREKAARKAAKKNRK